MEENYGSIQAVPETPPRRSGYDIDAPTCCCAFLCLLVLSMLLLIPIGEGFAWYRISQCSSEAHSANWDMIPPASASEMKTWSFTNLFWKEVDIFDVSKSNSSRIGYWADADVLFGLFSNFAYSTVSPSGEHPVIRAYKPFGLYLGKRYELWRCSKQSPEYLIHEDFWSRSFNPFYPQVLFEIIHADSGQTVAISNHTVQEMWSLGDAHWHVEIKTPKGQNIATLDQESFMVKSSWFTSPRWISVNKRPDLVPNEVISFLSAVFDIEQAKQKKSSHSSSSKGKR